MSVQDKYLRDLAAREQASGGSKEKSSWIKKRLWNHLLWS
jgi:hypothetical protein